MLNYLILICLGYTCFEKKKKTVQPNYKLLKIKCRAVDKNLTSSTQDRSSCTGPVNNSNYIKKQPYYTFHNHSVFILGLIFIQNV